MPQKQKGFTIIELIVTLMIIVIVTAMALVFINPSAQLARARNSKRIADVYAIATAIGNNMVNNRGIFTCTTGTISASSTRIATGTGNYNLAPCLIPTYISTLPFDPSTASAHFTSINDYDTAYAIVKDAATSRISVFAIYPELGASASTTIP